MKKIFISLALMCAMVVCANAQKMGMRYFLINRSSLEYQMLCFVVEILTYTSIGISYLMEHLYR